MLSSPLVTPSSALRVSELSVPSTIAMTRYLSSSEPSSITGRLPGHRFVRWRARVAFRSPKVLCDEVVDAQSRRTDAAVLVEALEIDRVLAFDDLARLAEQEAVHLARVRCPRVEHHAIAVQAVREGQSTAAFHPGLGFFLRGHGPAHESLDLVLAVDREAVMFPIDLADQDARPIAEAQLGEGWLRHQVVHRQAQGDVGFCARNTFSSGGGATAAALILPWTGAIAAFSVSARHAASRLACSGCSHPLLESRPRPQRFQSAKKSDRTVTCSERVASSE